MVPARLRDAATPISNVLDGFVFVLFRCVGDAEKPICRGRQEAIWKFRVEVKRCDVIGVGGRVGEHRDGWFPNIPVVY